MQMETESHSCIRSLEWTSSISIDWHTSRRMEYVHDKIFEEEENKKLK